jgi:serine/threonine-protein kinase
MVYCPTCGKHYSSDVQACPDDLTPLHVQPEAETQTLIDPLIGSTLDDKYRLDERLGGGGMGNVYKARHITLDRAVAVKIMHPRLVEDESARIRFEREAKALGRLQHLNAVSVTDFGKTRDGLVYIVMELLEGRTLRDILAREAPLEVARAVSLMLQATAAVAAAHEAGIIHRDLKPANILVTQSTDVPSIVKVLDFGIAKLAAETIDDDHMALTQLGTMLGTPRYMSPEQCDGLELTPAADVYSLGVILYEMLTGMTPFSGPTPLAIAVKQSTEFPRPPREIVASIPEDLERLTLHTLEKGPEDRPPNAAALRSELLETADRLGLEHHALVSTPDIDALREISRESPSGRLVVDLSRVREARALSSGSNEVKVIGGGNAADKARRSKDDRKSKFSRVDVEVPNGFPARTILWAGLTIFVIALSILGFVLLNSNNQPSAPMFLNANESVSPTPKVSPTATPTATPTPLPTSSPGGSVSETKDENKKKDGKGHSFMSKVKRILKKPF